MHKLSYLSFVIVVFGSAALLATQSHSQSGVPKNQVVLQPTTPGTSQSGNLNVSGTARAGQFVGGGAGLTNVTASGLQLPFQASASLSTPLMSLSNTSTGTTQPTLRVVSTANSTATLEAITAATSALGIYGLSDGPFGTGVFAETNGTQAIALQAVSRGANSIGALISGKQLGARIEAFDAQGDAVVAISHSEGGSGVIAESQNAQGTGLMARNLSTGASVTMAGPNGAVHTSGHYVKRFTGGTDANATPLAFGIVTSTGTVADGTGNFTVNRAAAGTYDVTVTGETYSNSTHVITITPVSSSPLVFGVVNPGGGAFRVRIWNLSSVLTDAQFQFTVWTKDPQEPNDGYIPPTKP